MITIKSQRALKLLSNLKSWSVEKSTLMKRFPGDDIILWAQMDLEGQIVKKLSFYGELEDFQVVLLESMASLLINKPITKIVDLTVRECEAFLRDRNSEEALSGMTEKDELIIKKVFQWLSAWPVQVAAKEYSFSSEKGPFRQLKLVDKVKEIKGFLNSPEILTLYKDFVKPSLVDVHDLTVYIQAPYDSQREKSLFEELHILGVEAFQEEDLNFIPEDL